MRIEEFKVLSDRLAIALAESDKQTALKTVNELLDLSDSKPVLAVEIMEAFNDQLTFHGHLIRNYFGKRALIQELSLGQNQFSLNWLGLATPDDARDMPPVADAILQQNESQRSPESCQAAFEMARHLAILDPHRSTELIAYAGEETQKLYPPEVHDQLALHLRLGQSFTAFPVYFAEILNRQVRSENPEAIAWSDLDAKGIVDLLRKKVPVKWPGYYDLQAGLSRGAWALVVKSKGLRIRDQIVRGVIITFLISMLVLVGILRWQLKSGVSKSPRPAEQSTASTPSTMTLAEITTTFEHGSIIDAMPILNEAKNSSDSEFVKTVQSACSRHLVSHLGRVSPDKKIMFEGFLLETGKANLIPPANAPAQF